jgi:hypothetical protein
MEILESIGWITLGFAPVFGSMELAWRLSKKYDVSKPKANEEPGLIKVKPQSTKLPSSTGYNRVREA